MSLIETIEPRTQGKPAVKEDTHCYHCGEKCDRSIESDEKYFCCDGCKFVYQLLQENGLCNYYDLSSTPGIKVKGKFSSEKFAYLDNTDIQNKLIRFTDGKQTHVNFYLPQMHCASCIWLLENLHTIQKGVLYSKTNFQRKEIFISYDPEKTTLRKIVELLGFVGYEPYISFNDNEKNASKKVNRTKIYKIGVAGFCFSNIMMLSFPEYFSSGNIQEEYLRKIFNWLSLALSIPVIFYSASDFFISAWKGIRQKWLNIDAPIALALLVTFIRSVYEVVAGSGSGYFDSLSGIVLFMLAGRWFQDKTYDSFSFDRDYKSYFPLGVTVIKDGKEIPVTISDLIKGDRIIVRNNEMVPADAILLNGDAAIDYSFVSGENNLLEKRKGELIYAGAKQSGGSIELEVVNPVSQSYITQLWNNNEVFAGAKNIEKSFIHPWSKYFTMVLFVVAGVTALYWGIADESKLLPAVTSSLIVACPCFLLLAATFTFGNMLRIFGKNKLYMKNASVIETLAKVNTIVFDKTGTLTHTTEAAVTFHGEPLSSTEEQIICSLARQSAHPLSRLITTHFVNRNTETIPVRGFHEQPGKGIEGEIEGVVARLGSFVFIYKTDSSGNDQKTEVWVSFNNLPRGYFTIQNRYRAGIANMVKELEKKNYGLHVLTGDNDSEAQNLQSVFGEKALLQFNQSPQDKLDYIKALQHNNTKVLMLGDGLNDAGALRQSNAGIAVSENTSQFTPASDAILDSSQVGKMDAFLSYARSGKKVVTVIFAISILYNIIGLSFAVRAALSPMVAAILMPISSVSIVAFVTGATSMLARRKGL